MDKRGEVTEEGMDTLKLVLAGGLIFTDNGP
jgi:hypothetical protein